MLSILRKLIKVARLSIIQPYRRALLKGVGAAIEHTHILAFLGTQKISTVIDIGANVGQFSLVARFLFCNATIYAFEPIGSAAVKFQSIFGSDPKVHFFQTAIGTTPAELEMHVSKSVDSSSLLPIGRKQSEIFSGTEESHLEMVNVAPLDVLLDGVELADQVLLKIDVQGYELEVLRGCENLLNRFMAVYVECSFEELYEGQALAYEVIDWIHQRGFYLARIGSMTYDKQGMSVQSDFLFLRRENQPNKNFADT